MEDHAGVPPVAEDEPPVRPASEAMQVPTPPKDARETSLKRTLSGNVGNVISLLKSLGKMGSFGSSLNSVELEKFKEVQQAPEVAAASERRQFEGSSASEDLEEGGVPRRESIDGPRRKLQHRLSWGYVPSAQTSRAMPPQGGRGVHSSTYQLNLSRF
jgi:hypothetical protein